MLMIPNYSFDWQLPYYLPRGSAAYPAGTQFEAVAHFDNLGVQPAVQSRSGGQKCAGAADV